MEEKQLLVHHLHLEEKRGEKMTLQTWFQVFTWKHSLQTFIWITNCSEYIPKNNLHIPLMPILRSQAGRFKDLRKYYLKFNLNLFAILHLSGKNFHVFFNSSCHEWHFIFLKPDLLTRDQSVRTFTTTTVWSTKHRTPTAPFCKWWPHRRDCWCTAFGLCPSRPCGFKYLGVLFMSEERVVQEIDAVLVCCGKERSKCESKAIDVHFHPYLGTQPRSIDWKKETVNTSSRN